MSDGAPTSYTELIGILENLPVLAREKRRREQLSLRDAAKQAGIGFSTISRCESGYDLHMSSVLTLLEWVGQPGGDTHG